MLPRAILMILPCVVGLNLWRALPAGSEWAIPTYAAGGLIVLAAMALVRYRVPIAAFTTVAALVGFSAVFVLQGDLALARIMGGGVLVVLFVSALTNADGPLDKAFAAAQGFTLLAWFAGNAARGTFGYEIAKSALGQAYGAYAEPALWLAILAAYSVAWYNHKANTG